MVPCGLAALGAQPAEVFPSQALAVESRVGHPPAAPQAVGVGEGLRQESTDLIAENTFPQVQLGNPTETISITMCAGESLYGTSPSTARRAWVSDSMAFVKVPPLSP